MIKKDSIKKGLSFGMTSGVITTLGLIVGLDSATQSKTVVLSGILVIAIADALSDALGVHISEEAIKENDCKHVWEATLYTFLSKFLVALTFVPSILILPINTAIIISILWGLFLIISLSFYIAKQQDENIFEVISEHFLIAVIVIVTTYYIGSFTSRIV